MISSHSADRHGCTGTSKLRQEEQTVESVVKKCRLFLAVELALLLRIPEVLGSQPSVLTFSALLSTSTKVPEYCLKLGHGSFLSDPFLFINHFIEAVVQEYELLTASLSEP
jgi:hypothetical protein